MVKWLKWAEVGRSVAKCKERWQKMVKWLKWAEVGRSVAKCKERWQKMVNCCKVQKKVAKGDKIVAKCGEVGQRGAKWGEVG